MAILHPPVDMSHPAHSPMDILQRPLEIFLAEKLPIERFAAPVEPQFCEPDACPMLMFELPVVFPIPALQPTLVLVSPVVLHDPAL